MSQNYNNGIADFRLDGFEIHENFEGGMAHVYKAVNLSNSRVVAIKVMKTRFASDPTYIERFYREAEVLSKLDHPGIVKLYSSSYEKRDHTQWHYMELEWLDGKPLDIVLSDYNKRGTPLPLDDINRLIIPLCGALGHAHQHPDRIVHRDLKPSNIILKDGDFSQPILMDFGIVYIQTDRKLTQQFQLVGSAEYMSPEHASNRNLDPRSDLYSLGIMLYEMVTGEVPFPDLTGNPLSVIACHIQKKPEPIRKIRPDIEEWLEGTIMRLLEKNPENRFSSVAEIISVATTQRYISQSKGHTLSLKGGMFPDPDLIKILEEQQQIFSPAELIAIKRPPAAMLVMAGVLMTLTIILIAGGAIAWVNNSHNTPPEGDKEKTKQHDGGVTDTAALDAFSDEIRKLAKLDQSALYSNILEDGILSNIKPLLEGIELLSEYKDDGSLINRAFENVIESDTSIGDLQTVKKTVYDNIKTPVDCMMLRLIVDIKPSNRTSLDDISEIDWQEYKTKMGILAGISNVDEDALNEEIEIWEMLLQNPTSLSSNKHLSPLQSKAMSANDLWSNSSSSVNESHGLLESVEDARVKLEHLSVIESKPFQLIVSESVKKSWGVSHISEDMISKAKIAKESLDAEWKKHNLNPSHFKGLNARHTIEDKLPDLFPAEREDYRKKFEVINKQHEVELQLAVEKFKEKFEQFQSQCLAAISNNEEKDANAAYFNCVNLLLSAKDILGDQLEDYNDKIELLDDKIKKLELAIKNQDSDKREYKSLCEIIDRQFQGYESIERDLMLMYAKNDWYKVKEFDNIRGSYTVTIAEKIKAAKKAIDGMTDAFEKTQTQIDDKVKKLEKQNNTKQAYRDVKVALNELKEVSDVAWLQKHKDSLLVLKGKISDKLKPSSPSDFNATQNEINKITLSWQYSSGDEYLVYRSTNSVSSGSAVSNWQNQNEFTDTSIAPGRKYYYTVMAKNDYGQSQLGSRVTGQALANVGPKPASPSGFKTKNTTKGVEISWKKIPGVSYRVYRSDSKNGAKRPLDSWSETNSTIDTKASRKKTYYYWIKSKNSYGESDYTGPVKGKKLNIGPPM